MLVYNCFKTTIFVETPYQQIQTDCHTCMSLMTHAGIYKTCVLHLCFIVSNFNHSCCIKYR